MRDAALEQADMESRQATGEALVAPFAALCRPGGAGVLGVGVNRGGILVGLEVAQALGAPFGPMSMQTLRDLAQLEHPAGIIVEPEDVDVDVHATGAASSSAVLGEPRRSAVAQGLAERRWRGAWYRSRQPPQEVRGRRVIVASDAASTGTTLCRVVAPLRQRGARDHRGRTGGSGQCPGGAGQAGRSGDPSADAGS